MLIHENVNRDMVVGEKVKIYRASTIEDVIRVKSIALEYHRESRYGDIPFSEEKFVQTYKSIIVDNSHRSLSLFVVFEGEIVGLMGAQIGDYFLGVQHPIATNYVLYVSPKIRSSMLGGRVAVRLMRLFIEWARKCGAREINIHATSGIEPQQTDKFLKRLGLKPYGGNYALRLTD